MTNPLAGHMWDHGGLQILMILTYVMGFIEKKPQPKFQVHRTIGWRDMAVLNLCKIQTRIQIVITLDWLDEMTPNLDH